MPAVANVAEAVRDPAAIRDLLVQQVTHSVRWREFVIYLKQQSDGSLLSAGRKAFVGSTKRIDKEITATSLTWKGSKLLSEDCAVSGFISIYITAASEGEAEKIALALVEELVALRHLFSWPSFIYRWQEK